MLLETSRNAITAFLRDFFDAVGEEPPAFLLVQEGDWRWVLAIHPEAQTLPVLGDQHVGSRHVLLVSNRAGAALPGIVNMENEKLE